MRRVGRSVVLAAALVLSSLGSASAQGTLRIGMTAADIPLTTGQTDQGGEGMRFMGYTVYDGLINWDLSSATKPSELAPGLATSWSVDKGDTNKWVFKLREGVKFHDGSEFTANAVVWNLDKLVLLPLPERTARVAALRSGQVDWIEAPSPDAVSSLKQAGFQIVANAYPHNWTWHLSRVEGSPWNDVRVRKAANLAIDRDGLVELLSGLAIPAQGFMPPGHPWFGNPTFKLTHDVVEAKKLLAEAGYGPEKPLVTKILISSSGSGQMQPLPMNEFVQQNLAEVGIKVEFEVVEWNALINIWRAGAKNESARRATGTNFHYFIQHPLPGLIRHLQCNLAPPAGTNWGNYCDPEMDKLFEQARTTFDPVEQTKVLQKIHEKYVDEALFLMVVHDVNPRALSPKVKC